MFIDTSGHSKGHITVKTVARGSYGETMFRQYGPAYKTADAAIRMVRKLQARGHIDIEVYDQTKQKRYYVGK